MTLDVHVLDSGQAVATVGPIAIRVIVSARTEIATIDLLASLLDRTLERSPIAGAWIIAHHGAPVPDKLVRRHAGRVLGAYGDRVCIAYSLLGLGFWASAATGATIALAKLMRMRSPIETSVERGAERLCMELIGVDPSRLIAAYAELIGQIEAHPHAPAAASGKRTNA